MRHGADPKAELILKAQIHAGGRGKGHFKGGLKGGVQICKTAEEVRDYAKRMVGDVLVTHQTGPEGALVSKLLVNEGIVIERELYFAILMDRAYGGPVIVASTMGGMDIEKVAEKNPEALIKVPVSIKTGLTEKAAAALATKLGFSGDIAKRAVKQFLALYDLFIKTDATQVEINPLAQGYVPGGESGLGVCSVLCVCGCV